MKLKVKDGNNGEPSSSCDLGSYVVELDGWKVVDSLGHENHLVSRVGNCTQKLGREFYCLLMHKEVTSVRE